MSRQLIYVPGRQAGQCDVDGLRVLQLSQNDRGQPFKESLTRGQLEFCSHCDCNFNQTRNNTETETGTEIETGTDTVR